MTMTPEYTLALDAHGLPRGIENGELSAVEVMEFTLDRNQSIGRRGDYLVA